MDSETSKEELQALDEEIIRFFQIDMQAQNSGIGLEIREFHAEFRNVVPRNERIELTGVSSPPEPSVFTVGLEVPLNELKERLLRD
ncbi:hypothetical protein SESBI_04576 [Sesbania bispinosa]|nr:hypothetical protein SESBI_04576 [Sesbania bispinosa]